MSFHEVKPEELQINPFTTIGSDWLLVTAGNEEKCNTMTASWGGMGVLWRKNVVTIYIRPQRYTKEFIDKNERFTLSVLGNEYRNALNICGSRSGRDVDKFQEAHITPYFLDGTTAVEEADMIFVCRKMYQQWMDQECFDDKDADKLCYPDKDYHMVYVAEIEKVLVRE